jgi:hypothetical protein
MLGLFYSVSILFCKNFLKKIVLRFLNKLLGKDEFAVEEVPFKENYQKIKSMTKLASLFFFLNN